MQQRRLLLPKTCSDGEARWDPARAELSETWSKQACSSLRARKRHVRRAASPVSMAVWAFIAIPCILASHTRGPVREDRPWLLVTEVESKAIQVEDGPRALPTRKRNHQGPNRSLAGLWRQDTFPIALTSGQVTWWLVAPGQKRGVPLLLARTCDRDRRVLSWTL